MGLKITLKPGEKMIVGGAVITNANTKAQLIIENRVPILRQKDILNEENADTPLKRIYFIIQLMYIDEANLVNYHDTYWQLVRNFLLTAPQALPFIDQISELIVNRDYYQAMKATKKWIALEGKKPTATHSEFDFPSPFHPKVIQSATDNMIERGDSIGDAENDVM